MWLRLLSEACHTGFLMFVDRERRMRGLVCAESAVLRHRQQRALVGLSEDD